MQAQNVNVYSLSLDGSTKLSSNFTVKEFKCSDGSDQILIHPDLVTLLQKIRDHYGKAVHVNCGYRTEAKNKVTKDAATYSQHQYGTAADIHINGVYQKDLAAYVETLMPKTGGIGIYSSFVHVDVRKARSRWNG